jgi:hypothetical protein
LIIVDSDHALSDRVALVDLLYFGGHIALAAIAYVIGRRLFNTTRSASAVQKNESGRPNPMPVTAEA